MRSSNSPTRETRWQRWHRTVNAPRVPSPSVGASEYNARFPAGGPAAGGSSAGDSPPRSPTGEGRPYSARLPNGSGGRPSFGVATSARL